MYTKQQVELVEGDKLNAQTLNRSVSRLYNNLLNTSFVETTAAHATSAINGTITFTDSISAVSLSALAVSPFTVNNYPKFINSYYNNAVSNLISYNNMSMQYISLMNDVLLVCGRISTATDSAIINLNKLFEQTPYTISKILYITAGGGDMSNTTSPSVVINSITNDAISLAGTLSFASPKVAGLDRVIEWFMLVKAR